MNQHRILFFDIETIARPEAVALLPEPEPPANYKDPAKIAAWVADARATQLSKAALDPDTGQIAAIALQLYPTASEPTVLTLSHHTEAQTLDLFWSLLEDVDGRSCGYNTLGFDLPYILRRSMANNVWASLMPDLRRYQVQPTTDLYGLLYNWQPGKGLKTVCKLYDIPNPLPDLDGSQVAGMDDETLPAYAANDVRLCIDLFERMATAGYAVPFIEKPRPCLPQVVSRETVAVPVLADDDVFPF